MLTEKILEQNLADLKKKYIHFLGDYFADWPKWVEISERLALGEKIVKESIPEPFQSDAEWAVWLLESEQKGEFDWEDPKLRELFESATNTPYYRMWGDIIAEISLRIGHLTEVNSFVEVGAGRADLTRIVLEKLNQDNLDVKLFITDSKPVIFEASKKCAEAFPTIRQETVLWNVEEPGPEKLITKVASPVLMYERAMLLYSDVNALANLAQVADILVLGDYFNYTGELFAYDEIFKKIGVNPLFYSDVEPVLDKFYPNQYILDFDVVEDLKVPYVSLVVAWR
jgi:hypothetical protein